MEKEECVKKSSTLTTENLTAKLQKSNRLFVGGDCLSSQQIAAYFSHLAATKKKHGSLNAKASSEEVEEFLAEEQMQEHEEDISLKKKVVFSNLQLEHPITYKSYNLCWRREINKEI